LGSDGPRGEIVSEEETDQTQPEPKPESKGMRELRESFDRVSAERDDLRTKVAEMTTSQRTAGLAQAGVKPDSYLGEAVLAVAERDSIYGADDIANLAKLIRSEGAS
jgi:hypothetical protein